MSLTTLNTRFTSGKQDSPARSECFNDDWHKACRKVALKQLASVMCSCDDIPAATSPLPVPVEIGCKLKLACPAAKCCFCLCLCCVAKMQPWAFCWCVSASPAMPTSPLGAVALVSLLAMQVLGQRVPAFPALEGVRAAQHTRLSRQPEAPTNQLPAVNKEPA